MQGALRMQDKAPKGGVASEVASAGEICANDRLPFPSTAQLSRSKCGIIRRLLMN